MAVTLGVLQNMHRVTLAETSPENAEDEAHRLGMGALKDYGDNEQHPPDWVVKVDNAVRLPYNRNWTGTVIPEK